MAQDDEAASIANLFLAELLEQRRHVEEVALGPGLLSLQPR